MFPAVRAALGKAGMASNLQGGIRDAPVLDGGVEALSLFNYQGTLMIALLLDHCMRNTPTGKQLQLCIKDLVLEIGMYGSLLEIGMYGSLWTKQFIPKMVIIPFLDLPCLLVHQ